MLNSINTTDRCGRYIGIEDQKVSYLKKIVDQTNAKIVLVSTWKEFWYKHPHLKAYQDELANYLDVKLAKQGLRIVDKTDDHDSLNRGAGIKEYLSMLDHHEILVNNYVILDDLPFDYLKSKLTKNLVKTSYDKGGLNLNHVKKAISILNNERKN